VHLITKHLRDAGFSVEEIYGDVTKRARHEIFTAFQKTVFPQVIVAQPSAMSHGLTLTASSTIVWYAPITSADTYGQANGRITRPGQTVNTLIVHISATPEERRMFARLKNKERMQGILLDMVVEARAA
jgi:SNF2 family DNA or RNA helicase